MTRMERITHTQLEELFPAFYAANDPIFLHGNPGIGKSDLIRELGKQEAENQNREFIEWVDLSFEERQEVAENPEDYFYFVDVRLVINEATDLKGLPNFAEEGYTKWFPPLWVIAGENVDSAGVIFLDEANLAPKLVQKVAFRLVNRKEIGQRALAEKVYVMAAGNTEEDQAGLRDMPGPLRDRFSHFRLERPEGGKDGSWVNWAVENDINPTIVAFIASDVGRKNLYTFSEKNADALVFATPRSWERVSDLLEQINTDEFNLEYDYIRKLVASRVGTGIAAEFVEFMKAEEEFDISDYIEDPSNASELNQARFDKSHAVLTAIADAYGRGVVSADFLVEIAEHIKAEYATFLFKLSRIHSNDGEAFKTELQTAIKASEGLDAKDILRVMA